MPVKSLNGKHTPNMKASMKKPYKEIESECFPKYEVWKCILICSNRDHRSRWMGVRRRLIQYYRIV